MKNRASSHLFVLLLIIGFEIAGYYGIHRAALLRGYETSIIGAVRDLLMYFPLVVLLLWLSRVNEVRRQLDPFHCRHHALLDGYVGAIPALQRSRIQRSQQISRASGEDGGSAHALHSGKLRSSQETDNGTAANPSPAHRHRSTAPTRRRPTRSGMPSLPATPGFPSSHSWRLPSRIHFACATVFFYGCNATASSLCC